MTNNMQFDDVGSLHAFQSASMSIDDRVAIAAPWVNKKLEEWEAMEVKNVGVQTFQEKLLNAIAGFQLSQPRHVDVNCAGVHPDNRERSKLVPVDVHDLLLLLTKGSWSWAQVDALCCEIPPNEIGVAWRVANHELAVRAQGMLAPYQKDLLEVVTGRGSHTTAAVRLYKSDATVRGIHSDVCNSDMEVSRAKILGAQPSLADPLEKGMYYKHCLRWQLVVKCPNLMAVLSRTGNASHGVHRLQTAVQALKRIHSLVSTSGNLDVDRTVKIASMGMPVGYEPHAKACLAFVQKWSGGADGFSLNTLEEFERTLKSKRHVTTRDLNALAKLDIASPR